MFPTARWLGNGVRLAGLSMTFLWPIIMKAGLYVIYFTSLLLLKPLITLGISDMPGLMKRFHNRLIGGGETTW